VMEARLAGVVARPRESGSAEEPMLRGDVVQEIIARKERGTREGARELHHNPPHRLAHQGRNLEQAQANGIELLRTEFAGAVLGPRCAAPASSGRRRRAPAGARNW
jgi:hypothetical protein